MAVQSWSLGFAADFSIWLAPMASLTRDCYNAKYGLSFSWIKARPLREPLYSMTAAVWSPPRSGYSVLPAARLGGALCERDLTSQLELAVEAMRSAGLTSRNICGLGITNQRNESGENRGKGSELVRGKREKVSYTGTFHQVMS